MTNPTAISLLRVPRGSGVHYALLTWDAEILSIDAQESPGACIAKIRARFDQPREGISGICLRAVEIQKDGSAALKETSAIFAPLGHPDGDCAHMDSKAVVDLHQKFNHYVDSSYPGNRFRIEILPISGFPLDQNSAYNLKDSVGPVAFDCLEQWVGRCNTHTKDQDTVFGLAAIMAGVNVSGPGPDGAFCLQDLHIEDGAELENTHSLIPAVKGEPVFLPVDMHIHASPGANPALRHGQAQSAEAGGGDLSLEDALTARMQAYMAANKIKPVTTPLDLIQKLKQARNNGPNGQSKIKGP